MGIRTGAQYIRALKVSREVWIDGQSISDISEHPTFIRPISSIAALYDMQYDPKWSGVLTYDSGDSGHRFGMSFLPPTKPEDLISRRIAIKTWADTTHGLMGRSPDFLNSALMAFGTAPDYFGQCNPSFAKNIEDYYSYCREHDLFLAHATINPQVDRSKAANEQDDPYICLRVVRETDAGVVVRGAKMIATLAPIADELIVFPLPGFKPGDEPYTIAFAIPIGTPGLTLICREPFDRGERSHFDHPLSSRYEEMDATCIFSDVLVPWNRVFFYGDVAKANALYHETYARHHTGHQGIIRGLAKAELLVGVAIALARSANLDAFLHVQEMLGELLGYIELVKGAILLSENDASMTKWGTLSPAIKPIQSLRYHFPRMYARMVEIVQTLGGGSLLSSPIERDFNGSLSGDIEHYFRGAEESAFERVSLLKLAWDITGDAFGQRQLLYERYHAGDPVRLAAALYTSSHIDRLLEITKNAVSPNGRCRQ